MSVGKAPPLEADEDDVDDDEEEEAPGANRGGVLQLLQQFSKAQAEGRGAGVGV